MAKVLLAFSAGFDSTGWLWKALSTTTDAIHCLHVDLSQVALPAMMKPGAYRNLHLAEEQAAVKIVSWLGANARSVTMETVAADSLVKGEWIPLALCAVAARVAKIKGYERFVYCRTQENKRSAGHDARLAKLKAQWAAMAPGVTLDFPLFDKMIGRAHAMAEMPAELSALALGCDDPTQISTGVFGKCGLCPKCHMVAEAKMLIAQGVHPDAILDYQLKKRCAGPYVGSLAGNNKWGGGKANPRPFFTYTEK